MLLLLPVFNTTIKGCSTCSKHALSFSYAAPSRYDNTLLNRCVLSLHLGPNNTCHKNFSQVQRGVKDNPGGLRAARQAFPFLEILARWAWRCETPEVAKKMSSTKSFGKKKFGKKKNAKGVRKGSKLKQEEEGSDVTVLPVAHTTAAVGTVGGVAELGVEGSQPSTPPVVKCGTDRNVAEGGGEGLKPAGGGFVGGARGRQDTGVAALLVALATADPSGDAIRSMQRWACEALLPEEVRVASLLFPPSASTPHKGHMSTALMPFHARGQASMTRLKICPTSHPDRN